jgi:hypothetical protein
MVGKATRSTVIAVLILALAACMGLQAMAANITPTGVTAGTGGLITKGGEIGLKTVGGTYLFRVVKGVGNQLVTGTNAAGGSANPWDYTATLGIMDNSDDFTLFDVNLTNANHMGSANTVQVMDIAAITGDANATETGIKIGTGWDNGVESASPVTINSTLTVTGAVSVGAGSGAITAPAGITAAVGTPIGITAGAATGGTTSGYAGGAVSTTGGLGSAGTTTGGAGGATTLVSGNGGTSVTGTTGAGGNIAITAGNAGAASGAGTSGAAGTVTITSGNSGATVAGTPAAAGTFTIQGGTGGATTSSGTAGAGAALVFNAGNGGAGATTGGAGGAVTIKTGTAGSGGSPASGALSIAIGATTIMSSTSAQGAAGNIMVNPLAKVATTVGGGALNGATPTPTVAADPSGSVFLLTHATPVITIPAAASDNAGVVWTFVNGGAGTTNFTLHGAGSTDIVANCLDTSAVGCHNLYWSTANRIIGVSVTVMSTGAKWIVTSATAAPTTHD